MISTFHQTAREAASSGPLRSTWVAAGRHASPRMRGAGGIAGLSLAALLSLACTDDKGYTVTPAGGPPEPVIECALPLSENEDPIARAQSDADRIGTLPADAECAVVPRTLSRLTRTEYNHSVQAALGTKSAPAEAFPREDATAGFSNNANALTVAPLLVEKYFEAARQLAAETLDNGQPQPHEVLVEAEAAFEGASNLPYHVMYDTGVRHVYHNVTVEGVYNFTVRAFGQHAGGLAPQMHLLVDGAQGAVFDVRADGDAPERYTIDVHLSVGQHDFEIRYRNDYYRQESVPHGRVELDRNLALDYIEIDGPYGAEIPDEVPAPRAALLTCTPRPPEGDDPGLSDEDCARRIFERVGRQLLRRPVSEEKVERWLGFVRFARADAQSFEHGVELALRAMLLDAEFLFRVEYDEDPSVPRSHLLGDHELAARLSYFLWSAPPDERLSEIADAGELNDPVVLETEVRRMLQDQQAAALTQEFAGQWLQTRAVADVSIDHEKFPTFSETLKQSMACETERVFEDVRRNGGSAQDLLRADFTYVNQPLAENYNFDVDIEETNGITAHRYNTFTRVSLDDTPRRGILTHSGILALGAHPERTSPVRRGNWVLKQLLCIPPPPPPPGVEGLPVQDDEVRSLREVMEQHREDPACAGCHVLMDPIGLAFEHFDAIGRYREHDGGAPIEISDSLLGEDFETHAEMIDIVADSDYLERCVVQHTLTYAIGRQLAPYEGDHCSITATAERIAARGGSLDDVFLEIALSSAFRMRRPMQPEEFAAPDAEQSDPDAEVSE